MKQARCLFEEKIERASRSGNWTDELLGHVAGCHSCEEIALVTSYLCSSSRASTVDAALPDAGRIWWKAQLSANAAAMERALRPIVWARRIAFGAFAVAFVAAIIVCWPRIAAIGGDFVEMWSRRSATASASHDNFMLFGVTAFLVILVPLVFGLYAIWSED
jgi:hypothetical protein